MTPDESREFALLLIEFSIAAAFFGALVGHLLTSLIGWLSYRGDRLMQKRVRSILRRWQERKERAS